MKRTFISLGVILALILTIVISDIVFITSFAKGLTDRLDAIYQTDLLDEKIAIAKDMDAFYKRKSFMAHRLIPTDRVEEIEMLLHKLNAYLKEEDTNEIEATAAELRARVNLLYSTSIYHWYHPFDFRIE